MNKDIHSSSGAVSRRSFLQTGMVAGAGLTLGGMSRVFGEVPAVDPLSFFIVTDTHYLAQREHPDRMVAGSVAVNDRLITTLNELPGQELPEEVGGGTITAPSGVIHLGDIIDTGDKGSEIDAKMTETEWDFYVAQYGLTGKEGKLRYPVYELHGNHDSPRHRNAAIQGIIKRNPGRPGVKHISENGLHYSWDWGKVHFISLGNVVGPNDDDLPIGRYDSFESLPFLISDLKEHVGDSGRPVVLLQHSDIQRYARPVDTTMKGGSREMCCPGMTRTAWCNSGCERSDGILLQEWSPADVAAYYRAIKDYNITAIFHGHLHSRRIERWNGERLDAEDGIPVFGSSNSGAGGGDRSLFYCRVEDNHLVIREYRSQGVQGWDQEQAQIAWSPTVWRVDLNRRG